MKLETVIVNGASGRMGRLLCDIAKENKIKLITVDQKNSLQKVKLTKKSGVLIDFSSPKGFTSALNWCVNNKVPMVSGTTGLTQAQFSKIKNASKKIPILYAANMSLGIHVMASMLDQLQALKKDFDFHIDEAHHVHKKDAPSGTALFLRDCLKKVVGKKIEMSSVRGGGIFGIHNVWAMGKEEYLQVQHQALDRKVFVRGALVAAKWLQGKKPGNYSMKHVLEGK